jgi:hypothetical protein
MQGKKALVCKTFQHEGSINFYNLVRPSIISFPVQWLYLLITFFFHPTIGTLTRLLPLITHRSLSRLGFCYLHRKSATDSFATSSHLQLDESILYYNTICQYLSAISFETRNTIISPTGLL